ncbi:D-Ala-D-Ala carboxypeptidase family metallohydrolase [Lysobacter capsici]|uniref:D-Ala-D-Ala carboxypeptidase family metallohydrolase n=1 Tax=Lysobacter capsici TaxID=435897 RepID=UPI001C005F30|nr:D-Ala-D-Ala carboxypeptidase family metallohydrolase [Lysobacter capsici]QWF19302.1 hypothetical protein KME82_11455 [Lysobacter capsici]
MAQLLLPDIPGAMQQGWEFGTRQRLQRQGEQRQNQLSALSEQAFTAPDENRNALLAQMEGVKAGAGLEYGQAFGQHAASEEERRNKTLFNMARTLVNAPAQMRAGLYQQMVPSMRRFGMTDAPPAYTPETASVIDQTAQALVQASMGAQASPSGFRELDMTARAAGYTPGTPEYQQAAQVALGMRGRAATGGFGFKEITGADGRTRWARQNPRTGTMEVYDETTGEFTPLGGGASLNPGGAPAGGSSASNLGSPITMPADLNTAFASLSNSFPGTQITSTTRTPQHNREVGGVANSQHLRGTAADFAVPAAQRAAFIEAARQQGFEAIDEGDHVHLELPPGARAPAGRGSLGVSQTPAEIEFAKQAAKNQADLANYDAMTEKVTRREAATTAAQAQAKTQAEVSAQQGTRARDANQVLTLLSEAEKLIPKSTGSSAGALVDTIAGAGGTGTEGAKAIAQLRAIAGQLTSKMPRMEGPQSNADVKMYEQMAGDLANPSSPREVRMAALQTIRQLNEKYAAQNAAGAQSPSAPRAPAAPRAGTVQDGYRFRGGNPADPNAWERL